MKTLIKYISLLLLLFSMTERGIAQENDSVQKFKNFKLSRIVFTGNGYCGFDLGLSNELVDTTGMKSTSVSVGLAPILLWKITSHLFFEGELDLMMEHGMVSAELGYANINYSIKKFGTIQVGKFLTPFGLFSERYHSFWVNAAPNEPLGFSHTGYSPQTEIGICVRNGSTHFNYAVYVSSSPLMNAGATDYNDAGKITYSTDIGTPLNENLGFGGRLGALPFKNSLLEIGASYKWMQLKPGDHYHGTVAHSHATGEDLTTIQTGSVYAVDLSLQKIMPSIKGRIEIKAQVQYSDAGLNRFIKLSPSGKTEVSYAFQNTTKIGYALLTYRPIFANKELIKKSGIYVRVGSMETPLGSLWYENTQEVSAGLNYSFNWHNTIKLGYQEILSAKKGYTNTIMIQWAAGF